MYIEAVTNHFRYHCSIWTSLCQVVQLHDIGPTGHRTPSNRSLRLTLVDLRTAFASSPREYSRILQHENVENIVFNDSNRLGFMNSKAPSGCKWISAMNVHSSHNVRVDQIRPPPCTCANMQHKYAQLYTCVHSTQDMEYNWWCRICR